MTVAGARSMAELLRARAERMPDALGFRFERDGDWLAWSWCTLFRRAAAAAVALRDEGIAAGDHVLMLVPEPIEAAPTLFGLWLLGAVPIQVGIPYRLADVAAFIEGLETTARRLRARALLVSARFAHVAVHSSLRIVPIGVSPDDEIQDVPLPAVDAAAAPALIQMTSGSTGYPRGVVIPNDRLMLHMAAMSEALPSHERSIAVSWLPLHHDMGLIGGLLFPFYNGFPGHMISPAAFRSRPLSWLETMSRFRGTICAAPPSAYGICLQLAEQARAAALDLGAWECAMVGAEPISPALLRRFAEAFASVGFRRNAFFPVYGLAEATVAVTFPSLGAPTRFDTVDRDALERHGRATPAGADAGERTLEFTGVGRPIPNTELRIVADTGRTLGEREVGEIRVRSTSLMEGYFDDPAATAAIVADGWLATGDLGYTADGVLFVTGREKDLIIKGGQNVLPAAVEEVAGADPDVRTGCVAAVGVWASDLETELVHVVCETRVAPEQWPAVSDRLRERLRARGIAVDRIVLVAPGLLPRTTSGKIRRGDVRAALTRDGGDVEAALHALGEGRRGG
jgi:acyl-CoA synthetase (AMP-forming)/AMP-acid ligase II